jgi:hypothetical protein
LGGKPITFQRALNRDVALLDAAYSCKGRPYRQKDRTIREQNAAVASPSQLRTIGVPALPRSNQIEATLFSEGDTDDKMGTTDEKSSAWHSRHYRVRGARVCG